MTYDYNREPKHDFDFVYKGKQFDHGHQVCRRIRSRNNGFQVEVEFCDGVRAVVPRQLVKNISGKEQ